MNYDARTDTLIVVFRDVILDYDAAGNIVSIEVDASRRVEEPGKVTLHTAE